ncbi:MAG: hypothetical protein ACFB51_02145 [Anaerolineae bacterium]
MTQLQPSFSGKSAIGVENNTSAIGIAIAVFGILTCAAIGVFTAAGGGLISGAVANNPIIIGIATAGPFLITGLICLSIVGVLVLTVGSRLIGGGLSRAKLEAPEVLGPERVRVGERFNVQYRQAVKGDINVTGITIDLLLREFVLYTSFTDTYTDVHYHLIKRHELPGGLFSSGSIITQDLRFEIPRNAIHTFPTPQMLEAHKQSEEVQKVMRRNPNLAERMLSQGTLSPTRNNRLSWHVHEQIDIERWPDFNQAFEVPVVADLYSDEGF